MKRLWEKMQVSKLNRQKIERPEFLLVGETWSDVLTCFRFKRKKY